MQNELLAVLAPTGNHTWSITIDGVTDEGFRAFWHGEGRTEFRRTEAGDVEHVAVAGLTDDFRASEEPIQAPVLSLSHPELWRKADREQLAGPVVTVITQATLAEQDGAPETDTAADPDASTQDHRADGGDGDISQAETL